MSTMDLGKFPASRENVRAGLKIKIAELTRQLDQNIAICQSRERGWRYFETAVYVFTSLVSLVNLAANHSAGARKSEWDDILNIVTTLLPMLSLYLGSQKKAEQYGDKKRQLRAIRQKYVVVANALASRGPSAIDEAIESLIGEASTVLSSGIQT